MLWLVVAEYSATGMWTRPKLIAPFHRTRGAGAFFETAMDTLLQARDFAPQTARRCRSAAAPTVRRGPAFSPSPFGGGPGWGQAACLSGSLPAPIPTFPQRGKERMLQATASTRSLGRAK